ncbi:MAG: PorV/PorQ family protein [Bacteroidales bacterium]|nr:PorV/PorQ family protein [Bacteroidales bacterium]
MKKTSGATSTSYQALFLIVFSFLVVIQTTTLSAQKYSNEFMAIGVGARSMAMGNSTVAVVSDATAGYWNPAGLSKMEPVWDLSLMHSEYLAGIAKYDYGAAAFNYSDSLKFVLSVIRFAVDDIPNTLQLVDAEGNLRYDRISSFSASDMAFLFSIAKVSKIEGLSYGANIKVIRRTAGDFASAWGFGIDLAAQYEKNNWRFGAVGRDITSTFNAWSFNTEQLREVFEMTGNEIPENSIEYTVPRLMLGAAYKFGLPYNIGVTPEIGLDATFDGKRHVLIRTNFISIDPHIGIEADYKKIIFLRFGVNNMQEAKTFDNDNAFTWQPNMGVGVKIWQLNLDYAFTNIGNTSVALYSHVLSLRLSIK